MKTMEKWKSIIRNKWGIAIFIGVVAGLLFLMVSEKRCDCYDRDNTGYRITFYGFGTTCEECCLENNLSIRTFYDPNKKLELNLT